MTVRALTRTRVRVSKEGNGYEVYRSRIGVRACVVGVRTVGDDELREVLASNEKDA